MAVELHRTSNSFPFPSPQEASFHDHDHDDDHDDDDDDDDRDLLYAQNPWDYFEALNDNSNNSNNQSELASSEETESSDFSSMSEFGKSWDFGGVWPCTTKIWSPFGSSYGSTEEGSSQEATPPTTPAIEKRQHVWDSNSNSNNKTNSNGMSVVTEDMEKMNIKAKENNNVELPKYPPISPPALVDHQLKAAQFYKMKHEILLKQRRLENNDNGGNTNNKVKDQNDGKIIVDDQVSVGSETHVKLAKKSERPRQPRKKWQNYHQRRHVVGPGMRMQAVFLSGAGSKAGPSCGTGVFLPPCALGDTSQSQSQLRKKKGCSPVLIPAKVMQALKDHFDRMDNLARQNNGLNFHVQRDYNNTINRATQNNGIGNLHSQKKRQYSRDVPASNQNDIGLPQDWTY